MPTKTDRILSYLPGTFRALPKPTALYAVADTFGGELLRAQNSLAALMMAHWVDHADKGAEFICDLACIAALYGLLPRGGDVGDRPTGKEARCLPVPADETVEEFREHLKRYVRTFLQGTATVQGVLRVVAEALGLHIADDYSDLDTWWTREDDGLVTVAPRGDDAAEMLFGFRDASAVGQPALPARAVGLVDLANSIDLPAGSVLRVKVDGDAPINVSLSLSTGAGLEDLVGAINAVLPGVASKHGRHLTLSSRTIGATGRLEVQEVEGDAAPLVLGLLGRTYHGAVATAAQVSSVAHPDGVVDLSKSHYLRLLIDGTRLAEIDCAGADPAKTKLEEVVGKINAALKGTVASQGGHVLTLASTLPGFRSSITFQAAAAQDAREQLFGPIGAFYAGRDAQPAQCVGTRDLGAGVDLSGPSQVRVQIDRRPAATVDCAGENAAHTRPSEIVAALNKVLGPNLASHDGHVLRLTGQVPGPEGTIIFEPLGSARDAADLLFGIAPRSFRGSSATQASLQGSKDLAGGCNLWARHILRLALDDAAPQEIDLRKAVADPAQPTLDEIGDALNAALGPDVASHDGHYLTLVSPKRGSASHVAIEPLEVTRRQRFVTRAYFTDEATRAVLGFTRRLAEGAPPTRARVEGKADLSRGVDVRENRFLRISVDGGPASEVDLAVSASIPRPRAAMPDEIIKAVNDAFRPDIDALESDIASYENYHLVLASRTEGAASRIAFEPPRGADALDRVLGLEPGITRGLDATGVQFEGTADLSAGVDLPANAAIKLAVDGASAVEISLADGEPAHKALPEIVVAINVALGDVFARSDGVHISLLPPGEDRVRDLLFAVPASGVDVTEKLFGISAPRHYHGSDAIAAQARGQHELSDSVKLGVEHMVRVAADGGAPLDVDVSGGAESVTLEQIVAAFNAVFAARQAPAIASPDGRRLKLESKTPGIRGSIELLPYTGGDAREALLGEASAGDSGTDALPAMITGQADLLAPVNLAGRRMLRLVVDGGRAVDVDVAGAAPEATLLDEVVARINAAFPGLASATDDDRLRLTSPAAGVDSRLEVLPLRALDLIEYPPKPAAKCCSVVHGGNCTIVNEGAAETPVTVTVTAPHGAWGASLVNRTTGQRLRLMEVLGAGETATLWLDDQGVLRGKIKAADGTSRPVDDAHLCVEWLSGKPSRDADRATMLVLPIGRSEWVFLECWAARFDQNNFAAKADGGRLDASRFPGALCREMGVFDVSGFAATPPEPIAEPPVCDVVVFAPTGPLASPPVEIVMKWLCYRPGALVVNLPADLPEQFGGRFNEGRFGSAGDQPELFSSAVTEPEGDRHLLVRLINVGLPEEQIQPSSLVKACVVPSVPIGWEAAIMPLRQPRARKLSGGSDRETAKLYLAEKDVTGFIELSARTLGAWGNGIAVTARKAGPARYDVTIRYQGARFENARQVALLGRVTKPEQDTPYLLAADLFRPGPVGVLHAKAAGVHASVTRAGVGEI